MIGPNPRLVKFMAKCALCGSGLAAGSPGVCGPCIRTRPEAADYIKEAHKARWRNPGRDDAAPGDVAVTCRLCVNRCEIFPGGLGVCGLRTNRNGRLVHLGGTPSRGILQWYFDPLPTNCVASWFCPECTGATRGRNLAVFYGACSFDCLFCQNSQYLIMTSVLSPAETAEDLAGAVDDQTRCVCYFGGDPTPQLPHAIRASELIMERSSARICFETNGSMSYGLLRRAAKIAGESGGIIKFDLKAWDENLHLALCGASSTYTKRNFRWLASNLGSDRMAASTLLVPGYVDSEEVGKIAAFIADLDPAIPYSLLAFYPAHRMTDLPVTSWELARECQRAALEAGVKRVNIGNVGLLGEM